MFIRNIKLVLLVSFIALVGCSKSDPVENEILRPLRIELKYEADDYLCVGPDGEKLDGTKSGMNINKDSKIRYVVRVFPVKGTTVSTQWVDERCFYRKISEGYNHSLNIELKPGNYQIMVWSDLIQSDVNHCVYDADDFSDIVLLKEYHVGNDCQDAFRGSSRVNLSEVVDVEQTLCIEMQRPLAKFEFISTDLTEFISREMNRQEAKLANGSINLDDYKVVFYYVGFVPTAYSIYSDRPSDSRTDVMFTSSLEKISESNVSLGSDYVFVNNKASAITIQVGVYDLKNTLVSLTSPIKVPLNRNFCTVMSGSFLIQKSSGGIQLDLEYSGDFKIELQ